MTTGQPQPLPDAHRRGALRLVAAISCVYDLALGIAFLVAADRLAALFNVPPASPPVLADTNGLFLAAVGVGYLWPMRRPVEYRWYLWVMGPLLKGGGALVFLRDVFLRGSPAAFLLFAASDGLLAAATLWALTKRRGPAVSR